MRLPDGSILPRAEFGPNDHRKDAPHFIGRNVLIGLRLNFENIGKSDFEKKVS